MLLIYGCTGYTGRLVVAEALRRGLTPVIAGRREEAVRGMAEPLGLRWRAFTCDAPDLAGADVLLNCAGPFVDTAGPLVEACLRERVHYVDVTGEIAVFEALAQRDAEARAAGVCLLPGAGFDVVPTDCLAAHLKRRLPGAVRLELAILGSGGLSHGTATTAARNLGRPGAVRTDGAIVPDIIASRRRKVDFGDGIVRDVVSIPWGDVSTAFRSTGIGNIVTYLTVPPMVARGAWMSPALLPVLGLAPVKRWVQSRIDAGAPGPSDAARAKGWSRCWGRVEDAEGGSAEAWWAGPEGYTLTAITAVDCAARLARLGASEVTPTPQDHRQPVMSGYHTPATAFGADYALTAVAGAQRGDVPSDAG